ncbi:small, acid-soluble spore protein, alpha/beta type [Dehalobacterium formicoaceticum]|uniref:Alpha/beta-type small acid-soluble spore protein n=1 Tax=Dehalobacterium formicoaceticum TaxID=51515 RepID=A0ABT1Y5D3_9FIRM|nr:small, acid-soluble spore protein, alpha/beta type [Dehalobacterium formicoaceticum]MCR6546077.1 alpha/beta-type small acid-soluble spore protein [Dehalobacterium formicoaceticum]
MDTKIKPSRKSKVKKTPEHVEKMKLEIAEELGLTDKVKQEGWAGLSAAETGKIGGLMTKKLKDMKTGRLN